MNNLSSGVEPRIICVSVILNRGAYFYFWRDSLSSNSFYSKGSLADWHVGFLSRTGTARSKSCGLSVTRVAVSKQKIEMEMSICKRVFC